MRCLNCQRKGVHFDEKICPPCTDNGVKKSDAKIIHKKTDFVGDDCNRQADIFVSELHQQPRLISHIRRRAVPRKEGGEDKVILTWREYEFGGTDGDKKAHKSK